MSGLKIATSLCPTGMDVQLECVRNLVKLGYEVVLVQPKKETNRPAIPGVTYRDCDSCPPKVDDLLAALPDDE